MKNAKDMASGTQGFGELRSVTSRSPDHDAFSQICELLTRQWAQTPEVVLEQWLPYTMERLSAWPRVMRRAPDSWVRDLFSVGAPSPLWSVVGSLEIHDPSLLRAPNTPSLEALGSSPYLTQLRHLDFEYLELEAPDLRALARSGLLSDIVSLNLNECCVRDEGISHLIRHSDNWGLRELRLVCNDIGDLGLFSLARSPWRESLETLDLSYNSATAEGWRMWLSSSPWPRLRALSLEASHLGEERGQALVSTEMFPGLSSLDLGTNQLGLAGLSSLLNSPLMNALSTLELYHNELGPQGARDLGSHPAVRSLRSLGLMENQLGSRGALALAQSPNLSGLESLDLGRNAIGDEGAHALITSPHLRSLRSLTLWANELGGSAIRALHDPSSLPNLERLKLSGNKFGEDALGELRFVSKARGLAIVV